jgi:hypothetical protein
MYWFFNTGDRSHVHCVEQTVAGSMVADPD